MNGSFAKMAQENGNDDERQIGWQLGLGWLRLPRTTAAALSLSLGLGTLSWLKKWQTWLGLAWVVARTRMSLASSSARTMADSLSAWVLQLTAWVTWIYEEKAHHFKKHCEEIADVKNVFDTRKTLYWLTFSVYTKTLPELAF